MHTMPLIRIPLTPISLPRVTMNGALMLPKFDIAYDTPVPVDRMEVGNDSVVISEKRAKAKVLKNRLSAIRISSNSDLATANCMISPILPDSTIKIIIHLLRYIFSTK